MDKIVAGAVIAAGVTAGLCAFGAVRTVELLTPVQKALRSLVPAALTKQMDTDPKVAYLTLGASAAMGIAGLIYLAPFPVLPVALSKQKRNLAYVCHPSEIASMIGFKFFHTLPGIPAGISEDSAWCYKKLMQTSRSFAAVILELHEELREAICIFYLVLRALDTVEDDMKPAVADKVRELQAFHTHLTQPGWNLKGYGDKKEEIDLVEQFQRVISVFMTLKPAYQAVIADICKRMGDGMAEFLNKKVVTIADYELYCHYVAGLVGYGLSGLFGECGLEDPRFKDPSMHKLSNSMGLYLQKTNIIRDYLEDISDKPPRIFYPRDIWALYADDIADFKLYKNKEGAVKCLNHMVTDAMKHALDCLDYLKMLRDPTVFKFCAIPQVMAIATLALCYNNHDVFRYEVKIRKGQALQLILGSTNYTNVCKYFLQFARKLEKKIPAQDPNAETLRGLLTQVKARCITELGK